MTRRNGPILRSWTDEEDAKLRAGAKRGRTALALSQRLGRSVPAVYQRAGKLGVQLLGVPRKDQRPMPADFRSKLHLTTPELRKLYRAGVATVGRWLAECGVIRTVGDNRRGMPNVNRRPLPANFAATMQRLGYTGTRSHYGAGDTAMRRWIAEAGIEREKRPSPPPKPAAPTAAPRPAVPARDWFLTPPPGYAQASAKLPPVRTMYEAR